MSKPLPYTSALRFTLDGRPSMSDIHLFFSTLIFQVKFSTHRYIFRNYNNTFTSENAIKELDDLHFSRSISSQHQLPSTYLKLERDMAKALVQQFLWTRLIDNAVEPQNRVYREKGLWRISSKGFCVLQDYCSKTKTDISKFLPCLNTTTELMYLIKIHRLLDNDRFNAKQKYTRSLFAIMIASLPLQQIDASRIEYECSNYYCPSSSSSFSTAVNSTVDYTFSDYFPHIEVLPNDLFVGLSYGQYPQWSSQKLQFKQQEALLQNLNPSSSNRFKMRSMFPSQTCCDWLIDYCTVASNDEAEGIMNEFLNSGWIAFYDNKHRQCNNIESSKLITLTMTRDGIKVVADVLLRQYNQVQQQQQVSRLNTETTKKRHSEIRSMFDDSNSIDDLHYLTMKDCTDERKKKRDAEMTLLSSTRTSISTVSLHEPNTALPLFCSNYHSVAMSNKSSTASGTPPLTPIKPPAAGWETNAQKLHSILRNARLQSLFRSFLDSILCTENLDFYIDYQYIRRDYYQHDTIYSTALLSDQQQLLEDAYALWEIYLKPGAESELNIDSILRTNITNEIQSVVTLAHAYSAEKRKPITIVSSTIPIHQSLNVVFSWLDKASDQIFKIMSYDLIPRFVQTAHYKEGIYQPYLSDEQRIGKNYLDTATDKAHSAGELEEFPLPPQRGIKETIYF